MRWLVLVLLLGVALAQCDPNPDSYETVYEVVGEDAVFTVTTSYPLPEECLEELNLSQLMEGPLPCSEGLTQQLYDPVYNNTGQLPAEPTCELKYGDGHFVLHGQGRIIMFVQTEGARKLISFPKWRYTPVNASDTLKIILPESVVSVEYVPRKDSTLEGNVIHWSKFPAESPEIVYTMERDYMPFVIGVAVLALAAAAFVGLSSLAKKGELDKKEKEIRGQMKQIQYQYMKQQMDEHMFRSLMEKAMKELAEVKSKKKMRK
ncbi:MAG: hypothetical protein KAW41_06380 [Candidatus Diapherotrites archaeon]|nr:hypothetical protein [Candidatus Diapherotrites archaeon]